MQFENCSNRWTFHPAALVKVNRFKVGDNVRIINDVTKVQELQKGHGEWLDIMALVRMILLLNFSCIRVNITRNYSRILEKLVKWQKYIQMAICE